MSMVSPLNFKKKKKKKKKGEKGIEEG